MRHVVLSGPAIQLLGMPDTPPHLFGLVPLQRRHGGWLFMVQDEWRIAVVRAVLHAALPTLSTPRIGRTAWQRLGT